MVRAKLGDRIQFGRYAFSMAPQRRKIAAAHAARDDRPL